MPNGSLKTSAHLLALKDFIIIAWAATCGRMVLQSPIAIVRISLFGIPADFQAPFAQSAFSWLLIEPFANALLDLFGIKFRLKGRQWVHRKVFF